MQQHFKRMPPHQSLDEPQSKINPEDLRKFVQTGALITLIFTDIMASAAIRVELREVLRAISA